MVCPEIFGIGEKKVVTETKERITKLKL